MAVDPNVAQKGGMTLAHAQKLSEFCSQRIYRRRKLLIIVRASNEESMKWQGTGLARPKHSGIKGKTDKGSGLVRHGSKVYYSDYDLQGVFIQDGRTYRPLFTGNYKVVRNAAGKVDHVVGKPGLNEFLRVLNQYVCGKGKPKMFIHGAQDDFVVDNTPQLYPKRTERYVVFEPNGTTHIVEGSRNMMMFYARNGLRWRYGQLSKHERG